MTLADGFAEGQRPEGVPAEADLEVTAELVDWKKVEAVTDDGAVMKKARSHSWPRAAASVAAGVPSASDNVCGPQPRQRQAARLTAPFSKVGRSHHRAYQLEEYR